jgi:hypothetical protein
VREARQTVTVIEHEGKAYILILIAYLLQYKACKDMNDHRS